MPGLLCHPLDLGADPQRARESQGCSYKRGTEKVKQVHPRGSLTSRTSWKGREFSGKITSQKSDRKQ